MAGRRLTQLVDAAARLHPGDAFVGSMRVQLKKRSWLSQAQVKALEGMLQASRLPSVDLAGQLAVGLGIEPGHEFLLSLKAQLQARGFLTPAQVTALVRVVDALEVQEGYAQRRQEATYAS